MIRTGAGDKDATLREGPHGHCIDGLITLNTLLLFPAVFYKSRRIEDNGIKLFADVPQIRLHVVTDEFTFIYVERIEPNILPRKGNGSLGAIDACYFLRPSRQGIQGEPSRVGETVQHGSIFRVFYECISLIALIEKKTCLLTVLHINKKLKTIFPDGY